MLMPKELNQSFLNLSFMKNDELGFDSEPHVEDIDVSDYQDIADLINQGVISSPQEYGFEDAYEFFDFFVHEVDGSATYDMLASERSNKWERFLNDYDEAGGILFNPENGNEWYTDDEELVREGI